MATAPPTTPPGASAPPTIDPTTFTSRLTAGQPPMSPDQLLALISNPSALNAFTDQLRAVDDTDDAAERERQRLEEEEAKKQDASYVKAVKMKELGNVAFGKGEWKEAYVCYSAAVKACERTGDAVFKLNRAAAGLKLNLYTQVLTDTQDVIYADSPSMTPKALFRRSQAQKFLGDFEGAERGLRVAVGMLPRDEVLTAEQEELKRVRSMGEDNRKAWIESEKLEPRTIDDIFAAGELAKLVEEASGTT